MIKQIGLFLLKTNRTYYENKKASSLGAFLSCPHWNVFEPIQTRTATTLQTKTFLFITGKAHFASLISVGKY